MPINDRPDIAAIGAQQANPPIVFTEIQDDFGVKKTPIYIYNVGPQEHNVPRPPNWPHLLLRACPADKDYLKVGEIEHPFKQKTEDANFNAGVMLVDGYREAMKMLNPQSVGLDQNADQPSPFHEGDNLFAYGCFWSTHNPPLETETSAARERLKKTYRKELETMVAVEGKEGPEGARARANNISHAAANYFGQSFSWHRSDLVPKDVNIAKIECGNCAEMIMAKAKSCRHCGAPTDPELLGAWLEQKFAEPLTKPKVKA